MKFLKLENNDELQANLFSFAIHLALFLVMIFSVGWQTKTPYYGEVELWDSVPVQKKINKTQATPKKKIKQNSMRQTIYTTWPMNQQNWNEQPMSICLDDTDVG